MSRRTVRSRGIIVAFLLAVLLYPAAGSTESPIVSFSLLSDIHIHHDDPQSHLLFQQAYEEHRALMPDADLLVLNGDLTNGSPADYVALQRLLAASPSRPFPHTAMTMGNHEYYRMWLHGSEYRYNEFTSSWSSAQARALFQQVRQQPHVYSETKVGDVSFLFLSGEAYRDVDASIAEDAYLSELQWKWLERRLAAHQRTTPLRPILLFLHQPLSHTIDGSERERGVVQHERLAALLRSCPFAVLFSGHTHADWETTRQVWHDQFTVVGSAAVRRVYTADGVPAQPLKSESLFVQVYADHIAIQAREHTTKRWIGQARIYPGRIVLLPANTVQ